MEETFTNIYIKNKWGGSGSGSNFSHTNKWFLNELRNIIDYKNIKTIADLGCGDWEIMKHFIFNNDEMYTGFDCVNFLIEKHNNIFKKDNINFIHKDISNNITSDYDLVIIKDVIQHHQDIDAINILEELINNNKYVFCINGYKFIRDPTKNNWNNRILDKKYSYHPIDFNKEPFTKFKPFILQSKKRGAKEYILFSRL